MKNIFTCCFFLLMPAILFAQSIDKSKSPRNTLGFNDENFLMRPSPKLQQIYNARLPKIQNNHTIPLTYLEQPEQFPLSEDGAIGVPVALSDSVIALAYRGGYDSLLFSTSADSGKTWSNPVVVASGDFYIVKLTGLRTNSGRIILIWILVDIASSNSQLKMSYTDDLTNWYTNTITENISFYPTLNLSRTNDDKLWLCYPKLKASFTDVDLFYITSTTDGEMWSNENVLLSGPDDEWDGTVVSGLSNELLVFYSDDSGSSYDVYKKVSFDGGITWTGTVPVLNSAFTEFRPTVVIQPDNTLWLFSSIYNPTNLLSGHNQRDIQYVVSSDGGNTWTVPERFTYYSGSDDDLNAALLFNKPFVSFSSSRWMPYRFSSGIWYGLIGNTEDSNPPPAVVNFTHERMTGYLSFIINAFVDDESGISDVKAEIYVNSVSQGSVQMYDDGKHNDFAANDYIWGSNIGPFDIDDSVSIIYSVTDISNNTVNVFGDQFNIQPLQNAGDLILSLYGNSQLGDMGNSYDISAFWHGHDYLYLGGLWISADISGEKRVMNKDYYEEDWSKTPGSIITIMPGISDQDCDMLYDDKNSPMPQIGLTVHQKSYQWSPQGRDDFIIFEYIIKNNTNNNTDNLYTSLWLDPDISVHISAYDDLGGYDPQSGMIYMYDPQGNPTGYLGSRLLTETPSTAALYTIPDPQTDDERYQLMTGGIMPDPTTPGDYRTLLTSQPFSLAPGDSHIVAFGLVMGNSLEELKANADTMKELFDQNIGGGNDNRINLPPTKFNLSQNYPNPFNSSTKINYSVPQSSRIQIKVFDVLGNEIETLVDEEKPAATYELTWNAENLSSGLYFYQLRAVDPSTGSGQVFIQTKKMILLK